MDWFPGVSQVKSLCQLATGDVGGAVETQHNFIHSCPGVAQVTSVVHLATGNKEAFVKTNKQSVQVISNMANGVPVVGHVKAVVHKLAGDQDGAEQAITAANRTTCVMAAGAGGFIVGGPVGSVIAGLGTGAAHDKVHSAVTGEKQGVFGQWDKLKNEPNAGNAFDAIMGHVGDGMTGYSAGQMVDRVVKANQVAANKAKPEVINDKFVANKAKLNAGSDKMYNMHDAKGGGGGGGGVALEQSNIANQIASNYVEMDVLSDKMNNMLGKQGDAAYMKLSQKMNDLNKATMALEKKIGLVVETPHSPKTGGANVFIEAGSSKQGIAVEMKSRSSLPVPTYERSQATITLAQTAPTRSQAAPTRSQAAPTRTQTATTRTQTATTRTQTATTRTQTTELIKSIEELLVYKNPIQQFQKKVYEKFGIRLEKGLAEAAVSIMEYVVNAHTTLKLKKKGVSLQGTFKKLIEDSVEDAIEEEDEGEDGETVHRTLGCIQWNMCGFVAQILSPSEREAREYLANLARLGEAFGTENVQHSTQFLYELVTKRPHILLLNELKVRDKTVVELFANSLGYQVVFSPSESSGRVPVRGTAIVYRPNKYLIFQSSLNKRPVLDLRGRPELEVVKAKFLFHSKQKVYQNGETVDLMTHNLTFVAAYLFKYSVNNFAEIIWAFNEFEDGLTIFAGDLNMEKTRYRDKWRAFGFVDMLEPGWKTNKQTRGDYVSESEIDYVMVKAGNEPYVTVFKPIKFCGRSLHYPIYFKVHGASAIGLTDMGQTYF